MEKFSKIAVIGGGVIGGGWVARFLLNGLNVALFDPAPDALAKVTALIANAERAYEELFGSDVPRKGTLTLAETIEEAVNDADFIQESIPENLELKKSVLAEIDTHVPKSVLICSSTSGLRPSVLQENLTYPERFMVGHPFNPVYLLPLVEICGGDLTSFENKERATSFYTDIGMKPLVLKKETDAFIADRLMEAYWREALWLVKEGIASVEEIDDAIRYGAGLRWAMMGTFQVYRIAGGDAGMRHFLSQFGPSLKWPWTKLMNVPELDDHLVETIVQQSDEQSGSHSIRELEHIRDDGLIGIMEALQTIDWGAGHVLKSYKSLLKTKKSVAQPLDLTKPLPLYQTTVKNSWIDYNKHMTEHRYLQVFGETTDKFLAIIGVDDDYLASGYSIFTLETHIRHLKEVAQGEKIAISTQLLGLDSKRIRVLHVMSLERTGDILATAEQMLMHVNTKKQSACDFQNQLAEYLSKIWKNHKGLPIPEFTGEGIRSIA